VLYLSVLTAAAWSATALRRRAPTTTSVEIAPVRFAVLIPAHDEALVISDTLEATKRLVYPPELTEVHVVADHCSDRTVELVRSAGVHVHECDEEVRGKGPALEWAIGRLLQHGRTPPDAIVIIDADTIVDPGLLSAFGRALQSGACVVQGQYRVRNPGASVNAGLRAAALTLRHHLRPLGRTSLGGSCGLYGNGMAFRCDVLRGRRLSGGLTEDIELQMDLLLEGTVVTYAPDAVVEAEMPDSYETARTQNERWERGRIELARRYVPKLLRLAVTDPHRRVAAVDAILDHLVPPLSVLVAATGGLTIAECALSLMRGQRPGPSGWPLIGALVVHVTSGLVLAKAPPSVYRSLAHAPGMVWWKLRLWLRMLARPGVEGWVRTTRKGSER
jgi:1,2-diacylglycerol 3-beta-glucosyltransferase